MSHFFSMRADRHLKCTGDVKGEIGMETKRASETVDSSWDQLSPCVGGTYSPGDCA